MDLLGLELGDDMDFTMRGQTELGGQLDPGVDGLTLEGFGHIELGFTDLVRTDSILVKNLDAELVVAASFTIQDITPLALVSHSSLALSDLRDVEGEGFIPDGFIAGLDFLGALLVLFIKVDFTIG